MTSTSPCDVACLSKPPEKSQMDGVYDLLKVRFVPMSVVWLWFGMDVLVSVVTSGWLMQSPMYWDWQERLGIFPLDLLLNLGILLLEVGFVLGVLHLSPFRIRRDRWRVGTGLSFCLACFNVLLLGFLLLEWTGYDWSLPGFSWAFAGVQALSFSGVAFAEEILFRWFLLGQFYRHCHYQNPDLRLSYALLCSQSLFALAHVPNRVLAFNASLLELLPQLFALFMMGLLFALVYLRTRSLVAAMVTHMLFNLTSVLPLAEQIKPTIMMVVLFLIMVWPWLTRHFPESRPESRPETQSAKPPKGGLSL